MWLKKFAMVAVTALGVLAAPAWAGLCQAPFMHDGGQTTLVGSGAVRLGADLAFTNVSHQGQDQCEARVQGTASYGLAGLPSGKSTLDYWMTVHNGNAVFHRQDDQGKRQPVQGKFDLRMLGLFAYGEPIRKAGQTFPALRFQINVDRKAVQADPIVVNTSQKTVGDKQSMDTAAGSQSCWPIRYVRTIAPTKATFNGIVLPIPGMTADVTDWFCPDLNMVMKQESNQSGVVSVMEVSKLN